MPIRNNNFDRFHEFIKSIVSLPPFNDILLSLITMANVWRINLHESHAFVEYVAKFSIFFPGTIVEDYYQML